MKNLSPEEIKAGNELLAKHVGLKVDPNISRTFWTIDHTVIQDEFANFIYSQMEYGAWYAGDLKFHESFDWLIHVCNRIICDGFKIMTIQTKNWSVVYISEAFSSTDPIVSSKESTLFGAYWSSLIKFVELQNKKSC